MNKFLLKIFNFFLILLGFFVIVWFLWSRFLRERLPANVPFILNELGFYFIFYIIMIYLYIVIMLIFPKKENKLIKKLIDIFYRPLTKLDNFIKNNKYLNTRYVMNINIVISYLYTITNKFNINSIILIPTEIIEYMQYINKNPTNLMIKIYILFNLIPRIFLLSFLIIDIFYWKSIDIFYSFIILGLFPLIHRYLKFSLKSLEESYIIFLENRFVDVEINDKASYKNSYNSDLEEFPAYKYHLNYYSIREYFKILNEIEIHNNSNMPGTFKDLENTRLISINIYPNSISEKFYEKLYNLYNIKKKDSYNKKEDEMMTELYEQNNHEFANIIDNYKKSKYIWESYNNVEQIYFIRILRIILYFIYFLLWSYILIISFHNVPNFDYTSAILLKIENIKSNTEIFSEMPIELWYY